MRGVSPVISTALLLLLAVGSIGALTVYLFRIQTKSQTAGETAIIYPKTPPMLGEIFCYPGYGYVVLVDTTGKGVNGTINYFVEVKDSVTNARRVAKGNNTLNISKMGSFYFGIPGDVGDVVSLRLYTPYWETTASCIVKRDENLVLWLKFDEGSGTSVGDSSKHGNDGTLHTYSGNILSGWGYRRGIIIDNTKNSNTLTDYQILVTLDTATLISAGKMRSDCGDIRFTDEDGTTLLSYWVEEGCNTANTKIWVKVPSIPASSTKTIYLYYGNPSATSQSNGDAVFEFFDDFEGSSLNTSKWDPYTAPSTYAVENGYLKMWSEWGGCCGGSCVYNHFNTLNTFVPPFAVESKFMVSGSMSLTACCNICYHTIFGNRDVIGVSSSSCGAVFRINTTYISNSYNFPDKDNWHRITKIFTPNYLRLITDYGIDLNYSGDVISSGAIGLAGDTDLSDGYDIVDWIFVRKYTDPEPKVTVGKEDAIQPQWVSGLSGYALQFDGVDDYVEVSHSESLNFRNQVTIAAWIKKEKRKIALYDGAGEGFSTNWGKFSSDTIYSWLSDEYNVSLLTSDDIAEGQLTADKYDLFIFSHGGENYPAAGKSYGYNTSQDNFAQIRRYLEGGGRLLVIGAYPFFYPRFWNSSRGAWEGPVCCDFANQPAYCDQGGGPWRCGGEAMGDLELTCKDPSGDDQVVLNTTDPYSVYFVESNESSPTATYWDRRAIYKSGSWNSQNEYHVIYKAYNSTEGADKGPQVVLVIYKEPRYNGARLIKTIGQNPDLVTTLGGEKFVKEMVETLLGGEIVDKNRNYGLLVGENTVYGVINNMGVKGSIPSGGGWVFVTMVYNGSVMKLYVDGELKGKRGLGAGTSILESSENLRIGYLFDNSIDDMKIYNRALSEAEIRAIYQAYAGG